MNGKPWDDPTSDPVADMAEQVREAERSMHEYRAPREVDPQALRQITDRLTVEDTRRFSDRIVVGGNSKVSFMRAEHAPTPGNFAAHAVDISGALAGVRKAALEVEQMHVRIARSVVAANEAFLRMQLMPSKSADRRTVFVLGKPMHYYVRDGRLHLAKGESPWN